MTILTPDAKKLLHDYLAGVRACVAASGSAQADDVQRDVTEHIDEELGSLNQPVTAEALQNVLSRLGEPREWVEEEKLPWWRNVILRLRCGPQDWRLTYIAFIAFVLALFGAGQDETVGPVLALVGMIVARAALSEAGGVTEVGPARKWLLYPPMLLVYIPVALAVLVWPLSVGAGLAEILEGPHRHQHHDAVLWLSVKLAGSDERMLLATASISSVAVGCWWAIVGGVLFFHPRILAPIFRPFVQRFPRGLAVTMIAIGAVAMIVGAVVIFMYFRGGAGATG